MYNQRIDYLHENPERAGFVKHPIDWKYSSAIITLRKRKVIGIGQIKLNVCFKLVLNERIQTK